MYNNYDEDMSTTNNAMLIVYAVMVIVLAVAGIALW